MNRIMSCTSGYVMYCGDKIVPTEASMMGSKPILGMSSRADPNRCGPMFGSSPLHVDPFLVENRFDPCSFLLFQNVWNPKSEGFSPSIPWQVWPVAKLAKWSSQQEPWRVAVTLNSWPLLGKTLENFIDFLRKSRKNQRYQRSIDMHRNSWLEIGM